MITWMNRISISEEVARNLSNGNDNATCVFCFYNIKTRKETEKKGFTIEKAILLAEQRREDGRYRNYEFLIF